MPTAVKPRKKDGDKTVDVNDLSRRLECYVQKQPGEIVRARKVGSHNYRLNWYSSQNGQTDGGIDMTLHQIIRSQFVSVQAKGKELVITDRTIQSERNGRAAPKDFLK